MIFFFPFEKMSLGLSALLLWLWVSATVQQPAGLQCPTGTTNLFIPMAILPIVSDATCTGQLNAANANSVRIGSLCDACMGGCDTNTRLCFRAAPLVCSFQFRVPIRFDSIVSWTTLRALQRISATVRSGGDFIAQQNFPVGTKMLNNDVYSIVRTVGAPLAVSSLQVQFFTLNEQAGQAAISRLLICGALAPISLSSILPPSGFVTPAPQPILQTPAPTAAPPSTGLTIFFAPPDESGPQSEEVPLSLIIGIAASVACCVLFTCAVVIFFVMRARKNARRETGESFGVTASRERPPQRTPGYTPSNLFDRIRRSRQREPNDVGYITMQPDPVHYKTMEMQKDTAGRPSYDQVGLGPEPERSYDHVPEVDQGYGYSSNGPSVTTNQLPADNYEIAAPAPYSTAADKPRF